MEEMRENQFEQNNGMNQQDNINKDARMWGMLCHLAGLAGFIVPIIVSGIIAPLVIWLIKREDDPFIDENGKEAVNFQITMSIFSLICIPFVFIFIGIFLLIGVGIFNLICVIIAAIKTNNGEHYRYPFAFRFIK
jgi:uncharacterized Tic20 family protein